MIILMHLRTSWLILASEPCLQTDIFMSELWDLRCRVILKNSSKILFTEIYEGPPLDVLILTHLQTSRLISRYFRVVEVTSRKYVWVPSKSRSWFRRTVVVPPSRFLETVATAPQTTVRSKKNWTRTMMVHVKEQPHNHCTTVTAFFCLLNYFCDENITLSSKR